MPQLVSPSQNRNRRATLSTFVWWAVVVTLAITAGRDLHGQERGLHSDVEVGSRRSRLYRELQPARTVGLTDLRVFLAAERAIPRNGTFFVVTGPRAAVKDPLVLRWVRRFARYYLLPRRLVSHARDADWIVSYGGHAPLGVRVERVIIVGPGIELIKVAST
jgi:hypothetical protein